MKENNGKVEYEVTCAREIAGQFRKVGDRIHMTPLEAKYYLPPHGSGLQIAATAKPKPTQRSGDKPGK